MGYQPVIFRPFDGVAAEVSTHVTNMPAFELRLRMHMKRWFKMLRNLRFCWQVGAKSHLAFGIWHLAFGIWHLAFGIWHLPFAICHLAWTLLLELPRIEWMKLALQTNSQAHALSVPQQSFDPPVWQCQSISFSPVDLVCLIFFIRHFIWYQVDF